MFILHIVTFYFLSKVLNVVIKHEYDNEIYTRNKSRIWIYLINDNQMNSSITIFIHFRDMHCGILTCLRIK